MKTKITYVFDENDVEILRKAKEIISALYNANDVEYDNDVETDLIDVFNEIEELCVDKYDLNKLEYIDYEEEEEEEEPVDYCEYCGCAIYEGDGGCVACSGEEDE